MMFTPSIVVDDVIDALANFLQPFCDGAEIVRAQVNRVAMPHDPCVVLTELLQVDLEFATEVYDSENLELQHVAPKRIDVQVDFYGPNAGDWCTAVKGAIKSSYAYGQFPDGIKPLYASDGVQSPLVTGEQQWESRWTITASLQYNPAMILPQDSADSLQANPVVQADA